MATFTWHLVTRTSGILIISLFQLVYLKIRKCLRDFLWELKELCPLAVMDYHIEYDIERALTRMAISRDYDDGIDFVSIIF